MASEFDLAPSPEEREFKLPSASQRSAKRGSPSPAPSGQRFRGARGDRAASAPRAASRGRRNAAGQIWLDPEAAVHQRVATDPYAVTSDDVVRQPEADREHMLVLKIAIGTLHTNVGKQAKVQQEQQALHFAVTRDSNKLKADYKQFQSERGSGMGVLRLSINQLQVG